MQDPANATHWHSGSIDGVDSSVQSAFNSSQLYLDVHTHDHPDGFIRGQNGRWNNVGHTELSGNSVVPPVVTDAWGVAAVTITDYVGWDWIPELTMHVKLQGLDDATAVTINFASLGENAPVIHALAQDPSDRSHWRIESALLDDRNLSGSNGWYIIVTTPELRDGKVRGQLSTASPVN